MGVYSLEGLELINMLVQKESNPEYAVQQIKISPDKRILVTSGESKMHIWDISNNTSVFEIRLNHITPLLLSSDLLFFTFITK
jgi:WD40 repeat protein